MTALLIFLHLALMGSAFMAGWSYAKYRQEREELKSLLADEELMNLLREEGVDD